MNVINDAWSTLRAEHRTETGWHVRRVHTSASCEILAGVLQPGAVPGLLLEVSMDDVPGGLSLPQSRGFSVEPTILQTGPSGKVRFALALSDSAYETVFSILCEDAAATAAVAPDPRSALRAWLGRLHVWQEFMSRHGAGGLSEEAALGLYGELWFLREKLMTLMGLDTAVDSWAGPRGEPDDFALPGGFIEVKATARQAPETIEISNIDQLDDRRGAILLAHLHLRSDADGETLAQLVAGMRSTVATEAPDRMRRFDDLLLAAGYVDTPTETHERPWRLRSMDMYEVEGDFPRVTRADVRSGVRNCRYSIDRTACSAYLVAEDAIARFTAGSAHV